MKSAVSGMPRVPQNCGAGDGGGGKPVGFNVAFDVASISGLVTECFTLNFGEVSGDGFRLARCEGGDLGGQPAALGEICRRPS